MGEGEGGAVELLMTQVQISTVPGVKKKKQRPGSQTESPLSLLFNPQ